MSKLGYPRQRVAVIPPRQAYVSPHEVRSVQFTPDDAVVSADDRMAEDDFKTRRGRREAILASARSQIADLEDRKRRNTNPAAMEHTVSADAIEGQLRWVEKRIAELTATIAETEEEARRDAAKVIAMRQRQSAAAAEAQLAAEFAEHERAERQRRFEAWKACRGRRT